MNAAGYKLGDDVLLALDCAASEYFKDGAYKMVGEGKTFSSADNAEFLAELASAYPIASIEDGMAEDDWAGWRILTDRLGGKLQLVGDDLFVTNVKRLGRGIDEGIANSILVKVNQIGTLTETIDAVRLAQTNGYTAVMSHRSGETEDLDDRRPRGRAELRADQDGKPGAIGPDREIQPAAPHRGRIGRHGALPGPLGNQGLQDSLIHNFIF